VIDFCFHISPTSVEGKLGYFLLWVIGVAGWCLAHVGPFLPDLLGFSKLLRACMRVVKLVRMVVTIMGWFGPVPGMLRWGRVVVLLLAVWYAWSFLLAGIGI
jgi:hypothetical protein